jgi:hypothetical protein
MDLSLASTYKKDPSSHPVRARWLRGSLRKERLRSALYTSIACCCMSGLAAAGTVSGTITVSGVKAGTHFTITIYSDDGKVATLIEMDQSGLYSINLLPGRYKARCTSPAPNTAYGTGIYLFALDGPVTRNLNLSCG